MLNQCGRWQIQDLRMYEESIYRLSSIYSIDDMMAVAVVIHLCIPSRKLLMHHKEKKREML